MTPPTGISALFHLIVILLYRKRKIFVSVLIVIGILIILGLTLPGVAQRLAGESSNLSRLTSLFERYRTCPERAVNAGDRHIVLRLDDVQADAWKEPTLEMVTYTLNRNIPMTLGIIPAGLDEDPHMVSYLRNNECGLEFAMHGWDHNVEMGGNVPEFGRTSEADAYTELRRASAVLEELLGTPPVTFIPPGNQYSTGTAAALARLGVEVISAEGTAAFDYDASPFDYDTNDPLPVATVVAQCQQALDADGLCVVMLHPQDYADGDILDEEKFKGYHALVDGLATLHASFVTFEDLISADEAIHDSVYSAWMTCCSDHELALESLDVGREHLAEILPMWYWLDDSGRIFDEISAPKAPIIAHARAAGIPIVPSVTNELDGSRVSTLLGSAQLQQEVISMLVSTAKTMAYTGWDLDWEGIPEADRSAYTAFVEQLASALHREKLSLSVTVHAQTGSKNDWKGVRGQDIASLAIHADTVRVMAYDYHHSTSKAGPVTPMNWFEDVVTYSVSVVPKDKLVIALPTYGYDWVGKAGDPVQYDTAISRLVEHGASWTRDAESQALTGTYEQDGTTHTIWFEDATSTDAKVAIARSHGVYHFTFWRLGGEDSLMWLNPR